MKVLLVNGSPHPQGCTYTALMEAGKAIAAEGIAVENFWIGNQPLTGCIGCGYCRQHGHCHYDDAVNRFLDLAGDYDGFIFGAPVHFASAAASMIAFMDRVFFADQFGSDVHRFAFKPGAAIVSARRAGTTAALEELNKYLLYAQMPIVSSRYWNMVHGQNPADVQKDTEGLQIMRMLGRNMAWMLKNLEAGKKAGIARPAQEERISTNFIR